MAAIYIAICDDNIANRKQTERLLNREKDARVKSSRAIIYIESFGSTEALLRTPIKYDLFILEQSSTSFDVQDLSSQLRAVGVTAPIEICEHLTKEKVTELCNKADEWAQNKIIPIELRTETETRFVVHKDIVYIEDQKSFITAHLSDNSSVLMRTTIPQFAYQLSSYGCFAFCGKNIVNLAHIVSIDKNKVILRNEQILTIPFLSVSSFKQTFENYQKEHSHD